MEGIDVRPVKERWLEALENYRKNPNDETRKKLIALEKLVASPKQQRVMLKDTAPPKRSFMKDKFAFFDEAHRSLSPFGNSFVASAGKLGYTGPRWVDLSKDYVKKNAAEESKQLQEMRDRLAAQNARYRSTLREPSQRSRLTVRERDNLQRLAATTTAAQQNIDKYIAALRKF